MEKREWKIIANCIANVRESWREERYTLTAEDILEILECHIAAEIHELCNGPSVEEFLKVSRER